MIEIDIPGYRHLQLDNLVLDYNGTLAHDGMIIPGVAPALKQLSGNLNIYVITADTFGKAKTHLQSIPCKLVILSQDNQDIAKKDFILKLGSARTVSIGNGRNDRLMLKESGLGIAVIQDEGAFSGTLSSADVICTSIVSALALLSHPKRLIATLRA
ncbi:MAG: ATPase P [Proteobacteria bacterium]|nr:ATPase P [Pseudomonadota bacterium]